MIELAIFSLSLGTFTISFCNAKHIHRLYKLHFAAKLSQDSKNFKASNFEPPPSRLCAFSPVYHKLPGQELMRAMVACRVPCLQGHTCTSLVHCRRKTKC